MSVNIHSSVSPAIDFTIAPQSSLIPSSSPSSSLSSSPLAQPFLSGSPLPSQHLVFVDSRVTGFDVLLAQFKDATVIQVKGDRDGISQISEVLQQHDNLASIHIISHGNAGDALLGSGSFNQNILASQSNTLQSWANHLAEDADILFYGCNVGTEAEGLAFVSKISQLTGADVAASDDLTGNAALGGDWDLEVKTGAIESADLLPVEILTQYQGTLATYNGNTYRLTNGAKSWEEAQAEARSLGGNLVTINNAAEETWLRQTFGSTERLWMGLTDRTTEGNFQWVSGETSTYRNWAPGEPNDFKFNGSFPGGEDFTLLNWSNGQWNDMPNNYAGTFRGIIEIPAASTFTYNGNTYRLTNGAKSWEEAQAEARSLGGNLVTINNAAEETWLKQTFGSAERLWMGLTDRTTEGNFQWVSGETSTYRNWAPGEPNDFKFNGSFPGGEDFTLMNAISGQWNDMPNNYAGTFRGIIEIPAASTFTYNGNTYRATNGAKSWEEAQAEARSLGGNLVTINNAAEETWLRQTFGNEGLWIGLSDRDVEGQFRWASEEPVTYTNWAPGEPNNGGGNQDYGWMNFTSTGQWDDNSPTAVFRGIIEISGNPGTRLALKDNATVFVNEGAGTAPVTVVRTGDNSQRITVEYTVNETGSADAARAGEDYTPPSFNGRPNTGQVVFEPGEIEKTFFVPIVNDTIAEGNETFAIGLQNPSAGSLEAPRTKLITIVDNDSAASTIAVNSATLNISENVGTALINITRSGNTAGSATVNFATSNGTATAGSDYTAQSGTITFAPGQVTQTIAIPITNDTLIEGNENLVVRLTSASGTTLGSDTTTTVTILDDDLAQGRLVRRTVVTGLTQANSIEWTPDGRFMLVGEQRGTVRVVENGTLRATPLIDLSDRVNGTRDRGLIGLTIHPQFFSGSPFVYLSYTYDPPETAGRTGLAGRDGNGNRPARLVRVTVNPTTMIADPATEVVLVGKNSTWAYTSRPDGNSTGDTSILPSGIVNGTTITAPANLIDVGIQDNDPDRPGIQNQNIRDYIATDSESHTIGAVHFGPDGFLYLAIGDGTSYNFADPRTVRVQDLDNLSGKILRVDPTTGQGVSTNPFFNGDPDSNRSKVFYSGLRNPFRFTFDPVTRRPVIGDVGWTRWEEINTGAPGANFGWPYFEGPGQTGGYSSLSQAISFYNNGNRNNPSDSPAVLPLLSLVHGAPDNASCVVVGDFYNNDSLIFADLNNGNVYFATLNAGRQISSVQILDSGIRFLVDMEMGPNGLLHGVNVATGEIIRWDPA